MSPKAYIVGSKYYTIFHALFLFILNKQQKKKYIYAVLEKYNVRMINLASI